MQKIERKDFISQNYLHQNHEIQQQIQNIFYEIAQILMKIIKIQQILNQSMKIEQKKFAELQLNNKFLQKLGQIRKVIKNILQSQTLFDKQFNKYEKSLKAKKSQIESKTKNNFDRIEQKIDMMMNSMIQNRKKQQKILQDFNKNKLNKLFQPQKTLLSMKDFIKERLLDQNQIKSEAMVKYNCGDNWIQNLQFSHKHFWEASKEFKSRTQRIYSENIHESTSTSSVSQQNLKNYKNFTPKHIFCKQPLKIPKIEKINDVNFKKKKIDQNSQVIQQRFNLPERSNKKFIKRVQNEYEDYDSDINSKYESDQFFFGWESPLFF